MYCNGTGNGNSEGCGFSKAPAAEMPLSQFQKGIFQHEHVNFVNYPCPQAHPYVPYIWIYMYMYNNRLAAHVPVYC